MLVAKEVKQSHISIDCIKTCPYQPQLVAVAYYQTNPTTLGALSVTHIAQPQHLAHIQPVECPPLLHLAWGKSTQQPDLYILAAASRTNDILIYSYSPLKRKLQLEKVLKVSQNIFCLYLDLITYESHYQMTVSSNQSTVFNLTLDPLFNIIGRTQLNKHEYAVWACRLSPQQKGMMACGDEVSSIYLYRDEQLLAKNSSSHKGGICDVVFEGDYGLLSGGFDGVICRFDVRNMKEHVDRKEWGGTIWRIIPNQKKEIILCNSSDNKFQVVDQSLRKELWNSGSIHGSLAYAADWVGRDIVAASFYDKKLCYWKRAQE